MDDQDELIALGWSFDFEQLEQPLRKRGPDGKLGDVAGEASLPSASAEYLAVRGAVDRYLVRVLLQKHKFETVSLPRDAAITAVNTYNSSKTLPNYLPNMALNSPKPAE